MIIEKGEIYKLKRKTHDDYDFYVTVTKIQDFVITVRAIYQPFHELSVKHFSDSVFDYYNAIDGYIEVPLRYNKDDISFNVHMDMLSPVSKYEINVILRYNNYTNRLNKLEVSYALDRWCNDV